MAELTREIALRIALAARVLPDMSVGKLLDVLQGLAGSSLTDEKLKAITVTNLKTGIGSLDGEEDGEDIGIGLDKIKLAVRYLWGEEQIDESLPEIMPYNDNDMPNSIRVAIASNDGSLLNGHFGSCSRFLVYQLTAQECRLIDIRSTSGADTAEDKNLFRAQLIKDCHIMFVQSIGGPAAAKVIRADIYPIKVPEVVDATEKLEELQAIFDTPPPWLAKALGRTAEERVRFDYSETA
jgi:nitrogen fixation protein NifX